ncbi:MAG: DNA polymerase Y family protein, partial [Devosiaceae bacterium]|nr:DNA polymerase Y family protein [Devosiaceae bacterium MH13]
MRRFQPAPSVPTAHLPEAGGGQADGGKYNYKEDGKAPPEARSAASPARVLIELSAHGPRIVAANPEGFQAGARIGQRLSDARAACPDLQVDHADSAADAAMLERLARFALRFSPIVAPDGLTATDAGLILDVGGCAHLFGGEDAMVDQVVARFAALGFLTLAGLAPTPLAARALARFADDPDDQVPPPILPPNLPTNLPQEEMAQNIASTSAPATLNSTLIATDALDAFPIEALDLDEARLTLLTRLGPKTIGAVRAVPRQALERRFRSKQAAHSVQLRLDQLLGVVPEPITPLRPPEPYRTALSCPEPVLEENGVSWALRDMLCRLEARLEREGLGARRFRLWAFTVDGSSSQLAVQLSR